MANEWWKDKTLWLGVLGFGGLVAALQLAGMDAVGQLTTAASDATFLLTDVFVKGKRLSHGTLDATGTVVEDPEALRAAASVVLGRDIDRNVYALARMLRSEGAKEGDLRVHVALNDLADLGWSDAFNLITYSTVAAARGRYGNQLHRRYSSAQDPYEGDVLTVEQAITNHDAGFDPAQGATKFVDKSSMGGVQAGTSSFDALVQRWGADGLSPFTVPEYGDDLVLFKKA